MCKDYSCVWQRLGTKLFNNWTLSDVTIILGPERIAAHSFVLREHSAYFETSLSSNFKESHTREYEFKEGSLQAYWRVFYFMYIDCYCEAPRKSLKVDDDDLLFQDARVYALALYFGMPHLQDYACACFKDLDSDAWSDPSFPSLIREIYDSTSERDDQLRQAVVSMVCKAIETLRPVEAFKDLVREGGDFAEDLIMKGVTGQRHG